MLESHETREPECLVTGKEGSQRGSEGALSYWYTLGLICTVAGVTLCVYQCPSTFACRVHCFKELCDTPAGFDDMSGTTTPRPVQLNYYPA